MKGFDPSGMIVIYNFVIGVLIMLSSEKVAALAGHISQTHSGRITRITYVSFLTLGACAALMSASIYVAFHLLRIGV